MNPLGDETGLLIIFGLSSAAVLIVAIAMRSGRRPVISTAGAGLLCGLSIYAAIAAVHLIVQGTGGYQLATWLVLVGGGVVPAAGIGLIEGLAAAVILRLMG